MSLSASNFVVLKANKPTVKRWHHSYVALFRITEGDFALIFGDKVRYKSRQWLIDIAVHRKLSKQDEGTIKQVVIEHISSFYEQPLFDFRFHINPRSK